MEELTQRQIGILKTIIAEYTENGQPVGSSILEKKYKVGVSPATIRNEMVELAKKGYLKKNYFSSGRVPSAKGFRFYIQHVMKEKELSTTDEISYKNSIWDERKQSHRFLSQAAKTLSDKTSLLSLIATENGDLYYSGIANLLKREEFFDLNLSRNLFSLMEEINFWEKVMEKFNRLEESIMYLLGEDDFRDAVFEDCASVFGEFESKDIKGIIGVVGPKRMSYDVIVPQVRFFSSLIEKIFNGEEK